MLGLSKNETERYSLFKAIRAKRWGQEDRRFIEEAGSSSSARARSRRSSIAKARRAS
jgi:hypothetical protein